VFWDYRYIIPVLTGYIFSRHFVPQSRSGSTKVPKVPAAVHAALRKEEAKMEEDVKKEEQKVALGFKVNFSEGTEKAMGE
jgi:hypothetical protein